MGECGTEESVHIIERPRTSVKNGRDYFQISLIKTFNRYFGYFVKLILSQRYSKGLNDIHSSLLLSFVNQPGREPKDVQCEI